MANDYGNKVWFFPDGDLPAAGDVEPKGHESLVILNPNEPDAHVKITVYFTDSDPVHLGPVAIEGQRVRCIRLDQSVEGYQIPFGQYALKLESDVGVIAQIGRMDVQQPNLAYYTTMGFAA